MSSRQRVPALAKWAIGAAVIVGSAAALQFNLIPGSDAILGATALAHDAPKSAAPAASQPKADTPDPTADQQKQLVQREADLQTREASVKAQETQVAAMLKDLTDQRATADAVKKVADMYAAMPPYKAAPILQAMQLDAAVQILRLLDQDTAGEILARMDPARGVQLTNLLMNPQPVQTKP